MTVSNPSSHGRRVCILANPRAGSGLGRRAVDDLVAGLAAQGLEGIVCRAREELTEQLAVVARSEVRCIVAAGGDGTLQEVLNRAPGFPVTVLPLGNENLVARYFHLPRFGRTLAKIIAADQRMSVDLARANGRFFTLMAGAGYDGAVVQRFHTRRPRRISHLSYALPMVRTIKDYSYPMIQVRIEDTGEVMHGAMVFVFNIPQYAMNLPIAPLAKPDDGLLDLIVFERPGRWNLLRYITAVALGRHERLPDVQRRQVRKMQLHSQSKVWLQTDGDPAGCLDTVIEAVPGGMTILGPTTRQG